MPPQSVKDIHQVHERAPDSQKITEDMQRLPQRQTPGPSPRSWLPAFINTHFRPIYQNKNPYIDNDLLKKLQIRVVPLSFTTGEATRGEQFIQPQQPQYVEDLLRRTKPFDQEGAQSDFVVKETIKEQDRPAQEEAHAVWQFINTCLTGTNDAGGFGPKISPNYTPWRLYNNPFPKLNRLSNINCYGYKALNVEWRVQKIIQPCLHREETVFYDKSRGVMVETPPVDPSKPHFTCFLTNHNEIREDQLSTAEVTTALYIAMEQAYKPFGQMHRFLPVTVVCCSSRTIRIVQGVLDLQTRSFELRVTRPVHFPKGARANWAEFLRVLGWLIGDPVGKTG